MCPPPPQSVARALFRSGSAAAPRRSLRLGGARLQAGSFAERIGTPSFLCPTVLPLQSLSLQAPQFSSSPFPSSPCPRFSSFHSPASHPLPQQFGSIWSAKTPAMPPYPRRPVQPERREPRHRPSGVGAASERTARRAGRRRCFWGQSGGRAPHQAFSTLSPQSARLCNPLSQAKRECRGGSGLPPPPTPAASGARRPSESHPGPNI